LSSTLIRIMASQIDTKMDTESLQPSPAADHSALSPAAPSAPILPSHTIYIQSLNEKLKLPELKRGLYLLFSQFGNVVEIVAHKSFKLRGQAWIIYDSIASATKSLQQMQGFIFYNKPIRVSFAKTESDVISKANNTFKPRAKRKAEGELLPEGTIAKENIKIKKEIKQKLAAAQGIVLPAANNTLNSAAAQSAGPVIPNHILFLENLPAESTELMLNMLFQQYSGFKQSRLVPNKPGIAFVEFQDQLQSAVAMEGLQGFKITPTNLMKIGFAKK
jgi:RNA recognition motif-containing protein